MSEPLSVPKPPPAPWWRPYAKLMFAIAAIIGFALFASSTAGPFRNVSGNGVSATAANRRLWNCHVPDDATDVWFVSGYRGTKVECTLSADSFKKWCRSRKWRVRPATGERSLFQDSLRDGFIEIDRRLRFKEMTSNNGFGGVYDLERGRAYVVHYGG